MAKTLTYKVASKIPQCMEKIKQGKLKGLTEASLMVQASAVRNITAKKLVDTGRLRASIDYEMISDDEAVVGSNVEYAPYVEFGSRKKAPEGYLRPAFDSNKAKIPKVISEAIHEALKQL